MLDAFEQEIKKAREAKGLSKWKKLQSIAGKLQGKTSGDITFTCSHPSHDGHPVKHVLGSSEGNLHFLLGYGNPGFHLADYHWMVMDPNLTEEDVKDKKNPSNLRYWRDSGLETTEEGDVLDGEPHPGAVKAIEQDRKEKTIEQEAVTAENGYRSYMGVPSMSLVFGLNNDHVYKWDLVRNSYLAATNPEFAEAMNEQDLDMEDEDEDLTKSIVHVPDVAYSHYAEDVFPLVKSQFPNVGTVVPVGDLNAVLCPTEIQFYTTEGKPAEILFYDQVYKSIDLTINGDIHPEVVVNFATNVLGISPEASNESNFIKGFPTPGYENVPAYEVPDKEPRKVIVSDGLYKAIP